MANNDTISIHFISGCFKMSINNFLSWYFFLYFGIVFFNYLLAFFLGGGRIRSDKVCFKSKTNKLRRALSSYSTPPENSYKF